MCLFLSLTVYCFSVNRNSWNGGRAILSAVQLKLNNYNELGRVWALNSVVSLREMFCKAKKRIGRCKSKKSKTGIATERPLKFISFNWGGAEREEKGRGGDSNWRSYIPFPVYRCPSNSLSLLGYSSLFIRCYDNNNTYSLF